MENNELQAKILRLEQENERLKEENAILKAYKDVNEDFKTAWEELKEDYKKLYQQKDLDNARWQKRCTDLHIEDKAKADKYWLILQEIKAICKMDCGDCQYNQDCDCNFEECEEAKIDDILDLITKAEEE